MTVCCKTAYATEQMARNVIKNKLKTYFDPKYCATCRCWHLSKPNYRKFVKADKPK